MNRMSQPGRFAAVGVGPGDPALLTLRAAEVIRAADVICHAGPADDQGRALGIIAHLLCPAQVRRTVLTQPMAGATRVHYRAGVERIAADCRAGRTVVFITEGDATLYSTAAHVWQLLAEWHPDIPIEVVPGVSAINAAAARVRWPLAQKDEPLLILPAHYHAANLRCWLEQVPNVCLLKPAKALAAIADAVHSAGREAVFVEEVSTDREWITHDLASAAGRGNYFSLVLTRTPHPSPPGFAGGAPVATGKGVRGRASASAEKAPPPHPFPVATGAPPAKPGGEGAADGFGHAGFICPKRRRSDRRRHRPRRPGPAHPAGPRRPARRGGHHRL